MRRSTEDGLSWVVTVGAHDPDITDDGAVSDETGPYGVADAEWQRVRSLVARLDEMEAAVAEMIDPDPDTLAKLDRLRLRTARATGRATLADSLAESLTTINDHRRRGSSPSLNRTH